MVSSSAPARVKRLLLVDADATVVASLARVLISQDWSVVSAEDNSAALRLAKGKPFDVIITGAATTGKQDVELLRQLRLVCPHVRLIILTDRSTPGDVIAAMRERAFSFFSKPFTAASFAEMVRNAMLEPAWDDGIEIVSATPEWVSLIVRCDQRTAERLVQFLREMSELPEPEKDDVASAFREMLLNAIEHGGNFDPTQYVEVAYVRTSRIVLCRIKDPGQGFSLDEIHHAATNNPSCDPIRHALLREAQGLRPGGYGLLMAKHLVDELIYSEKGNEVLLIKHLPAPPPTRESFRSLAGEPSDIN
jgi:DNA-binding NarL/FixJ family response regulator